MRRDVLDSQRPETSYSRRRFLGYAGGALAASALRSSWAGEAAPPNTAAAPPDRATETGQSPLIWANLLHLSYNMWCDRPQNSDNDHLQAITAQPYLRCDDKLWEDLTQRMADAGMNMVVIDLGDGVQYQSHPEIAVQNAWSVDRLRQELARLRKLGLEPIPKLNFSTAHDTWLGVYSRQVSTPPYYKVCEELIEEVMGLFDKPRFFHLGYDEETAGHQGRYAYLIVRQYELWWHDFEFFVKQVEQRGARPWIWSDFVWKHAKEFFEKMPKSVVQSNWYYDVDFQEGSDNYKQYVRWYGELDQHGYDQIPAGSNWVSPKNFGMLAEYCQKTLAPARLKGFLQTPWKPTLEKYRQVHTEAIDQVAAVIAAQAKPAQ